MEQWLTIQDVAKALRVHRDTILDWYTNGKFPRPVLLNPENGRSGRWRASVVEEHLRMLEEKARGR